MEKRAAGQNCDNLFYYTFPKDDSHNYEIDFLLSRGNKIVPLEVKSSGYKSHKSLDAFCEKFSSRIGDRILIYTKDYDKDGMTTCLPVYLTQFIWNSPILESKTQKTAFLVWGMPLSFVSCLQQWSAANCRKQCRERGEQDVDDYWPLVFWFLGHDFLIKGY